jgi:hypothetical protein
VTRRALVGPERVQRSATASAAIATKTGCFTRPPFRGLRGASAPHRCEARRYALRSNDRAYEFLNSCAAMNAEAQNILTIGPDSPILRKERM